MPARSEYWILFYAVRMMHREEVCLWPTLESNQSQALKLQRLRTGLAWLKTWISTFVCVSPLRLVKAWHVPNISLNLLAIIKLDLLDREGTAVDSSLYHNTNIAHKPRLHKSAVCLKGAEPQHATPNFYSHGSKTHHVLTLPSLQGKTSLKTVRGGKRFKAGKKTLEENWLVKRGAEGGWAGYK